MGRVAEQVGALERIKGVFRAKEPDERSRSTSRRRIIEAAAAAARRKEPTDPTDATFLDASSDDESEELKVEMGTNGLPLPRTITRNEVPTVDISTPIDNSDAEDCVPPTPGAGGQPPTLI